MRALRLLVALMLSASLGLSLLANPAQAGWRHWGGYGGYGYGGYGYGGCGYGYGRYGYGGYGYGYGGYYSYGGYPYYGYRSGPVAYSYSPMYAGTSYSYRPNDGSQLYAPSGSVARVGQPATGQAYTTTRTVSATPRTVVDVGAYDDYFQPSTMTVTPGTTVRWTNLGTHNHTVTSNQNLWDSGDFQSGASFTAKFNRPGSYSYYCRAHTGEAMRGVIIVQDESRTAAAAPPPASPAPAAPAPVAPTENGPTASVSPTPNY